MNEIPKIIGPNEKLIYEGKPELAPYLTRGILTSLFIIIILSLFIGAWLKSVIIAIPAGLVLLVLAIIIISLAYSKVHYAITNKRIIIQSGIIGRDFKSIDYDRMQNISAQVGILGVIFKVGTIQIFTGEMQSVGSGNSSSIRPKYDNLTYIQNPYETLKIMQTELSKRKEKLA